MPHHMLFLTQNIYFFQICELGIIPGSFFGLVIDFSDGIIFFVHEVIMYFLQLSEK